MQNNNLTRAQKQILLAVIEQNGLPIAGLYQLALHLEIDYQWARYCVHQLERMGLVTVERPHGREMYIRAKTVNGYWSFREMLAAPISGNRKNTTHNAQMKGSQMDPIGSLRSEYNKPSSYPRPELTQDETARYAKAAAQLNAMRDQRIRLSYIIGLVLENVRLLREVNEHRAARGFDPLPIYEPNHKK